jgi:hypothetical protein
MTNERKAQLFDNAITWIWEHTENHGMREYLNALKHIGYTKAEILEELASCNFDKEEEDLVLDYDAYELDLSTGNIKVDKSVFDDFVANTYINIRFVDDNIEGRIAQYKMISEDDEGIVMEYLGEA